MSIDITPAPTEQATGVEPTESRPTSLTVGLELGRLLSALGMLGLVMAVIGLSIYRYAVDGTRVNFAGPAFAICMFFLLVLAFFAAMAIRAAAFALADDTGARDRLFGFGAAAVVLLAILAAVSFSDGSPVVGGVAALWAAASVVSLVLISTAAANQWLEGRSPALNVIAWVRSNIVLFLGMLVLAYLYIPNVVVAAMSFNHEEGKRTTYQWYGFTTDNWTNICAPQGMCDSLVTSMWIGVVATILATLIGTLAAFSMRHNFAGRGSANTVLFLPMATPDIVMGSSLLALFLAVPFMRGHLGYGTIIIAHVMFCLSFVVVTVKARLAGMDSSLQEAAMDLYANETQTFWRVTFPFVFPGILAASLLSFSLSFDDYIITNLNAGTVTTFPIFVWGAVLRGLPMQVNVIGTIMFMAAILLVLAGDLLGRRRSRGR